MKVCFACEGKGALTSFNCQGCGKRAHPTPCCGSCGMRYNVPLGDGTVVTAAVSKQAVDDIYRLADEFDAVTAEEHKKDPTKPERWTAHDFVDWLRPDTTDYHDGYHSDYDGIYGASEGALPFVSMRSNRARVMEGNDDARSTVELQPQASLRNGKDRQEGRG